MAVRETLLLDLSQALGQIDDLERELDGLFQPIVIPVEIEGEGELQQLQNQIRQVDNDDIDIDVDVDGVSRAEREFDQLGDEINQAADQLQRVEREANDATNAVLRVGTRGASAFSNLRGSLLGVGAAFLAFQGAGAALDFFNDAIGAASDLEESTSKAQVVFGSFFDDIEDFASTAPQALGLANSAALEFTGTFGNLFVALGLSQEAAADLAPDIVQLGADLASFNNLEVTDALDKLRAGLVGEAEPLRALGVNLTAASTAAKAVELGLAGSTSEVSEAAKVQARYALILEQTSTAQGDFTRTADGIANRQRTLAANFENLRASVGEALLPAFEAILDIAPLLVDAVNNLTPAFATLGTQLGNLATDGAPVLTFLADLPRGFGAITDAASGIGNLVTAPIQGLVDAVSSGDITAGFDQIIDGFEGLGRAGDNLEIRVIEQDVIDALRNGIEPIDAFVGGLDRLREGSTLDPDSINRFLTITGVGAQDAATAIELLLDSAELTEPQVRDLLDALIELLDIGERGIGLNFQRGRGPAKFTAEINEAATALGIFQESAERIGETDVAGIFDELEQQFSDLPDGLNAAAAALRNEENEIVTDFTDFLEQLDDELAARQAFADNIAILESLGLGDLAQVFREAGLDASAALADAVANPEEAQRAEDLLDGFAREQAASFREAFASELSADPIDLTIPANVTAAVQSLQFQGLNAQAAVEIVGAAGAGPNIGGGVTVNNVYNGVVPSTTQEAQTAQRVNAIVSNFS